jgi:hypothetical protein
VSLVSLALLCNSDRVDDFCAVDCGTWQGLFLLFTHPRVLRTIFHVSAHKHYKGPVSNLVKESRHAEMTEEKVVGGVGQEQE